ncbi:hypothetical protein [Parahaliea aestuarii]|uniref:Uncharacterized protein n=1 Tax=Parahaliea aestuarii TaxID=1852021 RepID=A0A5C9A2K6_9GAMM|nr:hypothetical protein [Parahaliea aestuarii]TXS95113.1 hypothetical protein FVW59_04240 [Parahaliea aestuarii]
MSPALHNPQTDRLQRHTSALDDLILDVGTGRLRLGGVQASDEVPGLAVKLSQILRNARAQA